MDRFDAQRLTDWEHDTDARSWLRRGALAGISFCRFATGLRYAARRADNASRIDSRRAPAYCGLIDKALRAAR